MTAPLVTEAEKEAAYPHFDPWIEHHGLDPANVDAALEAAARVREDERRELVVMVRELLRTAEWGIIPHDTFEHGHDLLAKYESS